ncbi:MAG: RDD family protein [Alphaproteobacteria bacterium]|nr:MAG: RDD family protein [Alphaproteobacteria bacterium]
MTVITPQPAASPIPTSYAGFWWRALAIFLDAFLLNIAFGVLKWPLGAVIALGPIPLAHGDVVTALPAMAGMSVGLMALSVLGTVVYWLYFAWFESSHFQATPGKMICRLIVTDENGHRISFGRATGRHFAKILSGIILCIGYLMVFWTQRRQGLHDMLASTLVLRRQLPPIYGRTGSVPPTLDQPPRV